MSAPPPEALLEEWLSDLASDERAPGTIRRYKSAITSFLAWYAEVEQRSLALEHLSAIVLVGYRTFLQQTQGPLDQHGEWTRQRPARLVRVARGTPASGSQSRQGRQAGGAASGHGSQGP